MKLKLILFFCLISFLAQSQNLEDVKQNLIGEWSYVETVDSNGNKVESLNKYYIDGKESKILCSGPNISIYPDNTYIKVFTEINSDKGNWKLISKDEIEYVMVIPKESRQGRLIIQTQKMLNKKWRQDDKGNFLDEHSEKILLLTEDRMEVEYENYSRLIYKKITR